MRYRKYAMVWWTAEDVITKAQEDYGVTLTYDQAEEIVCAAEDELEDVMVAAGWQVLFDKLDARFGGGDHEVP